jgi:eukaryotic-like serine/threonine-protein kinase
MALDRRRSDASWIDQEARAADDEGLKRRMTGKDPLNISGQLVAEKYLIEHLVGEGGFAVVYRAEHTIWKQPVAVKFFSGLSQAPAEHRDELQRQFIQEGALLTELSSQTAGIVQARDVGVYTSPWGLWMPYMVLEWLEGSPLDVVLAQDLREGQPWSESETMGFLRRILPILDVAHRRGIAHRDIKPANIFVMGTPARSPEVPCKLLDFGVAKMVSDQAALGDGFAKTGMAITSFTPRYGAPEQFTRSYGATGPWTDVYAVALMASEMLSARVALQGGDLIQYGFASADPAQRPTPRQLGASLSDQLEAVFGKALAVSPQNRFQNAGEFLEAAMAATGASAPASFDPAITARSCPAPSSTMQLAATVLLPSESPPTRPPTLRPQRPAESPPTAPPTLRPQRPADDEPREKPESRGSGLGMTVIVLVVLVGGALAFSTTRYKGAKETRTFITSVVEASKKEASRWFPSLQPAPTPGGALAAPKLPIVTSTVPATPECPPGTRPVTPDPKDGLCIDELPISETEYAACATCEAPKLPPAPKGKGMGKRASEFCLSGTGPTPTAITCISKGQAEAYCKARGARLPKEDEWRGLRLSADSFEWIQTAKIGREKSAPFRCVHGR